MRFIRLALVLACLVGCASAPSDPATTGVSLREVRGCVIVTAHDRDGAHQFACEDGVHWSRVEPPGLATIRELEDAPAAERNGETAEARDGRFFVTRDLSSDDAAPGRWRVWERDGITWRIVATLPDDARPGF